MATTGTHRNQRCEFWAFNVGSNRISKTQEVACWSQFSFGMAAAGNKLCICDPGFEVDVHESATPQFEKTGDTCTVLTGSGLIATP